MNPAPPGWPRLSPALFYQDPASAIDFLERAFGFSTRTRIDTTDGRVEHSELCYGDAVVMVGSERPKESQRSPRSLGGAMSAGIFLYVDDVDAHFVCAEAAGAEIVQDLSDTDYGEGYWKDRGYGCLDPEGHHWWFAQRL